MPPHSTFFDSGKRLKFLYARSELVTVLWIPVLRADKKMAAVIDIFYASVCSVPWIWIPTIFKSILLLILLRGHRKVLENTAAQIQGTVQVFKMTHSSFVGYTQGHTQGRIQGPLISWPDAQGFFSNGYWQSHFYNILPREFYRYEHSSSPILIQTRPKFKFIHAF